MKAGMNAWLGATMMLVLCPALAVAQQSSQSSSAPATQQSTAKTGQKTKPRAAKSAKVWTDDDVRSLRTPEDTYREQEVAQATDDAAAAKQSNSADTKQTQTAAPPRLSNPKTVEDANGMIGWEQRDIDSQQAYLEQLQNQLESAPEDQKAHLQDWIQQEVKTIADTRKELEGLVAQKQALEKKAAAGDNTTSGKPPSH